MSILPVRNLGGAGIISDVHPYDLPPNALSAGVNIRFENGKITRAPVMRRVHEFSSGFEPAYAFAIPSVASGADQIVVVKDDFSSVLGVTGDTEVDLTPASIAGSASVEALTHTFLGGVAYLNRPTHIPFQKRPSDALFTPLTAWNSGWRCASLRSYKDFLIALNVTKSTTEYPTMVKWSDVAGFGGPPASWDETSTTNSAGENILNEMENPIVDGLSLRDSFIIYGHDEVWIMDYIGGNFLFRFRKLFNSAGIINQNCVTQVDGLHYVFGADDIWLHDGATKRSIAHGKDKDFIFAGMDRRCASMAFVTQDPTLNEIHFCYVSQDRLVGFRGLTQGCNRAAVYNYRLDTWSFYDLPNVVGATASKLAGQATFASIGSPSYDDIGGSYLANDDGELTHSVYIGRSASSVGLTASRIYGLDRIVGGQLVKPLDAEALKPAFAERVGIDLDEEGTPLTSYKVIHAFYPQIGVEGDDNVEFQFGAAEFAGQEPLWGDKIPYHPLVDNKVDTREAGRYLGWRMYYNGIGDFSLSGFDGKVVARGRR